MSSLAPIESGAQALTDATLFQAHLDSLHDAPKWLIDLKQEAWERFLKLPMPVRKNELWRFANVNDITLDGYKLPSMGPRPAEGALAGEAEVVKAAGSIDFVDDWQIGSAPVDEALRGKGVIFLPILDAIREHPDLLKKHLFERMPDLGSEKFQALHVALFSSGSFLYVPKGVELDEPFVTSHWAAEDGASLFPHTLVVAEDNAKVTMLDFYRGRNGDARNFVCAASDVYAMAGAKVDYRMIQNWTLHTLAFHLNSATAERDSELKTITVNIGGAHIRNEQHGRVVGKGANVAMHSLGAVKGKQELDQRTLQTHAEGCSTSDLLYKNALLDQARTIFSGLIRVEPDAQQTDAYQTNRNLLLSPEADANSLPGLEIEANDVKCSHGATAGKLDETELFYFLARGIPRSKAQELMVFGFFEEIIGKFDNDNLANYVRGLIESKFTA